jgi:hypothetical protein
MKTKRPREKSRTTMGLAFQQPGEPFPEQPGEVYTPDQQKEYPPLTVLPVADDPTRFYCLGNSGWWYEVRITADGQPASCECQHRKYRGAVCHHLKAVGEFIAAGLLEKVAEELDQWKAMSESDRKAIFA